MSETTHIICARCGHDHSVSNAEYSEKSDALKFTAFGLYFHCPKCSAKYPIHAVAQNKSPAFSPEEQYAWLTRNAGSWSVTPDQGKWTRPDGSTFYPRIAFAAFGTAFNGLTFEKAVCEAMKLYSEK